MHSRMCGGPRVPVSPPPPPLERKAKIQSNINNNFRPNRPSCKNPGLLFGFLCSDHLLMAICPKMKLWPLPVPMWISPPQPHPQMRKLAYAHVNSSGNVGALLISCHLRTPSEVSLRFGAGGHQGFAPGQSVINSLPSLFS